MEILRDADLGAAIRARYPPASAAGFGSSIAVPTLAAHPDELQYVSIGAQSAASISCTMETPLVPTAAVLWEQTSPPLQLEGRFVSLVKGR